MHVLDQAWRALRHLVAGRGWGRADSLDELCERSREQVVAALQRNEQRMSEQTPDPHRARGRALDLLLSLLNPDQCQEFQLCRHFHVIGGSTGTRYRIRVASFANIDVLDSVGKPMYRLCAHPAGDIPVYDVMAAQMLFLQDSVTEECFLQKAKVYTALTEVRIPSKASWIG